MSTESVLFSASDGPSGDGIYQNSVDDEAPSARVGGPGQRLSWHEDGVVLYTANFGSNNDIYSLRPAEPGSDEPVLASRWNEMSLGRSPDGRWMAYMSDEGGSWGLYVRRYPGMENKVLVTEEMGFVPMQAATWGPDGRSVNWVTVQGIRTAHLELDVGTPRVISTETTVPLVEPTLGAFQDRHPETGRLLRFRSGTSGGRRLMMSTDWVEELRRRFEPGG